MVKNSNCITALLSASLVVLSAVAIVPVSQTKADDIPDVEPPVAAFFANATVLTVGDAVEFNATNSTDNVGIVLYSWSFDDHTANVSGNGTLASVVNHTFAMEGVYFVSLKVYDAAGNTNKTKKTITVIPLLIFADLYLSDLSFSDKNPVQGKVTQIRIFLGNQGEKPAVNFTVLFMDGPKRIKYVFVQKIDTGESRSLTVDWRPSNTGIHNIIVIADSRAVVPEFNETNNLVNTSLSVAGAPLLDKGDMTVVVMIMMVLAAVAAGDAYLIMYPRKRT